MINISLPDGSVRSFDKPVSGARDRRRHRPRPGQGGAGVAASTARMVDLAPRRRPRRQDRDRHRKDPEALELLRHDAAHVLAEAVQELFPGTQVTIGPAIEDGFYYDFARDEPFTPDDLRQDRSSDARDRRPRRCRSCARSGTADEAVAHFKEHRRELQGRDDRRELPADEDDLGLLAGRLARPVPRPASAVDGQARQGLQADEAGRRLLARRRQERRSCSASTAPPGRREGAGGLSAPARGSREARPPQLGREMDLFHMQEEAAGLVFWHPKGWTL